jgi:hypothetical protein
MAIGSWLILLTAAKLGVAEQGCPARKYRASDIRGHRYLTPHRRVGID